jgi:hypothetical protein
LKSRKKSLKHQKTRIFAVYTLQKWVKKLQPSEIFFTKEGYTKDFFSKKLKKSKKTQKKK